MVSIASVKGVNVDLQTQIERRMPAVFEELDELKSLGIDVKRKSALNSKQELEKLARIIKQSMYEDYKLAYSKKGEKRSEEAKATVNI
jgi:hypothetical protein